MYTRSRQRAPYHPVIDVVDATLTVNGEPVHTYESTSDARRAARRWTALSRVGCSPVVCSSGEVTACPDQEQREALRVGRMLLK